MKLIIDISENRFKDLQRIASIQIRRRSLTCEQIIANGTPLEEELEKIKKEIIKSCNNIAQEVSDLSYTRKIYVYEQLSEIKGAIENHISELKGEKI